jgi:hypothetical protein
MIPSDRWWEQYLATSTSRDRRLSSMVICPECNFTSYQHRRFFRDDLARESSRRKWIDDIKDIIKPYGLSIISASSLHKTTI